MKHNKLIIIALSLFFATSFVRAQEGLPVYSDYLTDNYYLLHPAMAGAASCTKIRITGRQQWFGEKQAPRLMTASINGKIKDSKHGLGAILFADKNGYHTQNGAYLTYAHHLMFSRNESDLNMLSFGMNVGAIQYKLDESTFPKFGFDPIIAGIEQSATNLNVDVGFSYHNYDFYAHATVKNLLKNNGINFNKGGLKYDNLRTYIGTIGKAFSTGQGKDWMIEPSVLVSHRDATKETFIDGNLKAYKYMDFGKLWGGLSYRRSFDGAQFQDGKNLGGQKLQLLTPFLGANMNNFMFSYTYSYQMGDVVFNNGGFHQVTLGYNINCAPPRLKCHCPAIY